MGGLGGIGGDDDVSVQSMTSRVSALSVASAGVGGGSHGAPPSSSGRTTAAQRRRWQQQQKQLRRRQEGTSTSDAATTGSTGGGSSGSGSGGSAPPPPSVPFRAPSSSNSSAAFSSPSPPSSSRRQQPYTGSQPYLCEVLHDSYGTGAAPPRGLSDCHGFSASAGGIFGGRMEGACADFFPPASTAGDLMVFNTSRPAYGSLMLQSTAGTARGKTVKREVQRGNGQLPRGKTTKTQQSSSVAGSGKEKAIIGGEGEEKSSSKVGPTNPLAFVPEEEGPSSKGDEKEKVGGEGDIVAGEMKLPENLPSE